MLVFNCSNYTFPSRPDQDFTWESCKTLCAKAGSELVSIESQQEWRFLKNTIQTLKAPEYFIGLKRERRIWKWRSGHTLTATEKQPPWASGEPTGDGNCVVMYRHYQQQFGLYNDLSCETERRGCICERLVGCTDKEGKEIMISPWIWFLPDPSRHYNGHTHDSNLVEVFPHKYYS